MHSYCLYCFEALGSRQQECPACGRTSMAADRRIYWNRSPRLRKLQTFVTLGSFACAVAGALLLVQSSSGPGAGWLFALPIGAHVAVAQTAGKLTKHMPHFRASLFWTQLCISAGVALAIFFDWRFVMISCLAYPVMKACAVGRRWKTSLMGVDTAVCDRSYRDR